MPSEKKEIIWRAAEYEHRKKDVGWYWITGGLAGVLILIALWQKNFFFAFFIVLAGVMIFAFGKRRPQIYEFRINGSGIYIGEKITYNYEQLESFSIHNWPGRLDELVLKKKAMVNPYLKIPIDSKLAVEARAILLEQLPEVEYQESLIDAIADWLGF